jgi:hypothetical protein
MASARVRGFGIGSGGAGSATAANPTDGGGSNYAGAGFSLAPATGEIGDALTGRITLGVVNFTILAMIAFYVWTRGAQGG